MIKAFLAHSRADKKRYVDIVARKLGNAYCVYDEYSFEAGMKPIEEILRGLDESQIFVVFISEPALISKWVQYELLQAHKKLAEGLLKRIFPIIVDKEILHSDPRIPQWMQDQYNLKYVSRPIVAARRIRQRQREISWEMHPKLAAKDKLFVGRNKQLGLLEERLDDFAQPVPTCIIASGLPRVGRSTLLRFGLAKGNIVRWSYEFPSIVLHRGESVEDLLLKLYDLSFSDRPYPAELMDIPLETRLGLVIDIVRDIQQAKEMILVHDDGCLVNYTRELQPWFDRICQETAGVQVTFLLSSRYRPRPESVRQKDYLYAIEVPELSYPERCGFLKRLLDLEHLAMGQEDFSFFAGLQFGLPDQVRFACDLIQDYGIDGAKRKSHEITEFNSDRASVVLAKYSGKQKILDFLYLLSEFEFISFTFLYSIVPQEDYQPLIDELIASAVCDFVGVEKEFIRLNDTIRDFVRRNRIEIPAQFKEKLNDHLERFLAEEATEDRDISDLSYSIRQAIKTGRTAPKKYLVPSHFISSMRELYQSRGHLDRVIELADMLLIKPRLLEPTVEADIRYYLCLSLARKRDKRLLEEVQAIRGPEHDFLLGFYYRLQGRAEEAIDRLLKCVNDPSVSARARRELVQVYLSLEDYEAAASLAQKNYEESRKNAYHIQAYFESLINSRRPQKHRDILLRLINELRSIDSDIADQMAQIAKAEFVAKFDGNYPDAVGLLQNTISHFPDSHYPMLTLAYLAARQGDLTTLQSVYHQLKEMAVFRTFSENSMVRLNAYIYCLSGDLPRAISYANSNLRGCPQGARESLIARLRQMASDLGQDF